MRPRDKSWPKLGFSAPIVNIIFCLCLLPSCHSAEGGAHGRGEGGRKWACRESRPQGRVRRLCQLPQRKTDATRDFRATPQQKTENKTRRPEHTAAQECSRPYLRKITGRWCLPGLGEGPKSEKHRQNADC